MAKKQDKFEKQDEQLQEVNNALSGAGQWIINHSKMLTWCLTIIILVILGIMLYKQYVVAPKHREAVNTNGSAVVYFMMAANTQDAEQAAAYYEMALNGNDEEGTEGFASVADRYDFQEGKLAALYAGMINYRLGNYEDAVAYLQKFSSDDAHVNALAQQLLGDAYAELGQLEDAANAFEAAAATGSEIIAPMSLKKAGLVYIELGDNERAHAAFATIKERYAVSQEAQDVDKYIEYTK